MSQTLDCSSFISASMNELSLCNSPTSKKLTPRRLNKSNPNLSRFSTKKASKTPISTPKTPKHAFDRFIPNRSTMNLELNHYLVSDLSISPSLSIIFSLSFFLSISLSLSLTLLNHAFFSFTRSHNRIKRTKPVKITHRRVLRLVRMQSVKH